MRMQLFLDAYEPDGIPSLKLMQQNSAEATATYVGRWKVNRESEKKVKLKIVLK